MVQPRIWSQHDHEFDLFYLVVMPTWVVHAPMKLNLKQISRSTSSSLSDLFTLMDSYILKCPRMPIDQDKPKRAYLICSHNEFLSLKCPETTIDQIRPFISKYISKYTLSFCSGSRIGCLSLLFINFLVKP